MVLMLYIDISISILSLDILSLLSLDIMSYTKVSVVLKDSPSHDDYNKRIIEYLNDRHPAINDNKFTIAIEVADDSNINDYVREGMESIPAIKISEDSSYVYGVNSIIALLSKLEMPAPSSGARMIRDPSPAIESLNDESNAFYKMAMEEMQCDDQEDPDAPSTLKAYHQETPEAPLNDKAIEEKTKAYSRIYEERRKRFANKNGPARHGAIKPAEKGKVDVDKFIQSGGFDKGEEMLMRQIAQNL